MLSLYGLNSFLIVKGSLLLCCVYRPPSKVDFYDLFILECEKLILHNARNFQKILVLGDLNSDLLNTTCRQSILLHHLMTDFNLSDLFHGPTRITESSCSHLDVFLSNTPCSFRDVTAVPCHFSDHHVVLGDYYCRKLHNHIGHKIIQARCYSKLDPLLL